jgi:hypothetical protein
MKRISRFLFPVHRLLLFCCFALFLPAVLSAANIKTPQTLAGFGESPILKDDVAKAREVAIGRALDVAVDRVALMILPSEQLADRFESYHSTMKGRRGDYIQTFRVLAESREKSTYRVLVEATVAADRLSETIRKTAPADAAESADAEAETPARIMLFIAEQGINDDEPRYWWNRQMEIVITQSEGSLAEKLAKGGFTVVDHGYALPNLTYQYEPDRPNIAPEDAMKIGRLYVADLIIIGKATVHRVPSDSAGAAAYTATIFARMFNTASGRDVATVKKTATAEATDKGAGPENALRAAGALAGREFLARLTQTGAPETAADENILRLFLRGERFFGNFIMFRKQLNKMPEIGEIRMREMSVDRAVVDVVTDTSAGKLAKSLKNLTFPTFSVRILQADQKGLRLELIPR